MPAMSTRTCAAGATAGTLSDKVEEAFDELVREGVEPSVRKIRHRVGYGSHTDITAILFSLKADAAAAAASLAQMPDSLIDKRDRFAAQLWGAMQAEAKLAVEEVRARCAERVASLEAQLAAALVDADAMQKELDEVTTSARQLADGIAAETDRHGQTGTELEVARGRLADSNAQVQALQRIVAGMVGSRSEGSGQTLALAPIAARVEKAVLKAVAEGGPVVPSELDDRLSGLGAFLGRRLRKVVDQLVASGRLAVDGEGRVVAPSGRSQS